MVKGCSLRIADALHVTYLTVLDLLVTEIHGFEQILFVRGGD